MPEPKYGQIIAEFKEIPEDEPLFLIRGQDALSVQAVEAYASLARAAASGKSDAAAAQKLHDVADECQNVAAAISVWQSAHPDRVKLPD